MTKTRSNRRFALFLSLLAVTLFAPASSVRAAQPKIKIGYNTDDVEKAKLIGFDYAELLVKNFAALSDAQFTEFLAKIGRAHV